MSFLISLLGVSFSIIWLLSFFSITFISPLSPKCRSAKTKWTSEEGFKVVRYSVVERAKGKVVREFVDPDGPSDIQHIVIVWGLLRLVPTVNFAGIYTPGEILDTNRTSRDLLQVMVAFSRHKCALGSFRPC